ncbi:MAG: fasciclin domain-containing protein [Gemmataceae bacterium]
MLLSTMRLSALLVAVGLLAVANVRAEEEEGKKKAADIVDTAVAGKFTKLVAAVKAADLVDTLKGKGPFTVFAPTDKAFEALGEETLKAVLNDKEKLKSILTYHVVAGVVPAKKAIKLAKDGGSAKTVQGGEIKLSLDGDSLVLNGSAKVIKADIKVANGVIHVIDKVILPPAK